MVTRAAFEKLIADTDSYKKMNVPDWKVRDLRRKFKENNITLDKMEELLLKSGWKKKPEKWSKGKSPAN